MEILIPPAAGAGGIRGGGPRDDDWQDSGWAVAACSAEGTWHGLSEHGLHAHGADDAARPAWLALGLERVPLAAARPEAPARQPPPSNGKARRKSGRGR
jgi:hypothetical protein